MATVARAIALYRRIAADQRWSKSKQKAIDRVEKSLGRLPLQQCTEDHLVDWARQQKGSRLTAYNTIAALSGALKYCHRRRKLLVPHPTAASEACKTLVDDKSVRFRQRDPGRISDNMIRKILSKWRSRISPEYVWLLVDTPIRSGELCRITWADTDLDPEDPHTIVRDRKDPRDKWGNDDRVSLLGRSRGILQLIEPKTGRICPHHQQSLSQAFRRASRRAGYQFRLHDLRHEGITRMAAAGMPWADIMKISGHKSPQTMLRYTHPTTAQIFQNAARLMPAPPLETEDQPIFSRTPRLI